MSRLEIVKSVDGDWVRIVYDNRIVFDGHSFSDCHIPQLIKGLQLDIEVIETEVSGEEINEDI